MVTRRKPLTGESPGQLETGLHLKVQWSENALLQLRLSEEAVLRLAPLLLGLVIGSVGTGLINYLPSIALPGNPPADVQLKK